ncbi:MAG: hypothetical protein HY289_08410 [Planctomycetes bacterium]|nr:hypothetical protein [Planctomycetota bacterium]
MLPGELVGMSGRGNPVGDEPGRIGVAVGGVEVDHLKVDGFTRLVAAAEQRGDAAGGVVGVIRQQGRRGTFARFQQFRHEARSLPQVRLLLGRGKQIAKPIFGEHETLTYSITSADTSMSVPAVLACPLLGHPTTNYQCLANPILDSNQSVATDRNCQGKRRVDFSWAS